MEHIRFKAKAGMTREDLALQNAKLMSSIAEEIKRYAPDSIVILTTNPVDAMAYVMYRKLGFSRERVIGYGWLDTGTSGSISMRVCPSLRRIYLL